MIKTSTTNKLDAKKIAQTCCLIVSLIINSKHAGANNNDTESPNDYGYDYGAACDFVGARYYDIESRLREKSTGQVPSTDDFPVASPRRFHYSSVGVSADYLIIEGKNIVYKVHFDGSTIFPPKATKGYFLSRFRITQMTKPDTIKLGCDNATVHFQFDLGVLMWVEISENHID